MSPAQLPVPRPPGRPKDPDKRLAILEAAKRLFPEHGFDAVSMDAIAAEAGVSKLTVYSHFGDKESLFMAAVSERCCEQLPATLFCTKDLPLRDALLGIAGHFFALATSDDALALQRTIAATSRSDPALGALFWQAGPARVRADLEAFLSRAAEAGEIDVADVSAAAGHLLSLLKGEILRRLLFADGGPPPPGDDAAFVAQAVDFFLAAVSPRH